MPYLPTPTPVQVYIITHEERELVRGFRASLDTNSNRISRDLISILGEDRFVSNAIFIENHLSSHEHHDRRYIQMLDGFTTTDAHLSFYRSVQKQVLTFTNNEAQLQNISLGEWLKDLVTRFDTNSPLKDISNERLEVLLNYQEINDSNHDLLVSVVAIEILDIFCKNFISFIKQSIEEEEKAKKVSVRTDKGLTILFLSAQPLPIASIGHCIVNHVDYDGFVINAKLLTDTNKRKDGWVVGFSNENSHINFFKEHHPKIKAWFEHIMLVEGLDLMSIDALKRFAPPQFDELRDALRGVILNNDNSCRIYPAIAKAAVLYLNEKISADFIEFSKNKEPLIKKATVYVGNGNHSPSLADSMKNHLQKNLDGFRAELARSKELESNLTEEERYEIAFNAGYAQAKEDMLKISSQKKPTSE